MTLTAAARDFTFVTDAGVRVALPGAWTVRFGVRAPDGVRAIASAEATFTAFCDGCGGGGGGGGGRPTPGEIVGYSVMGIAAVAGAGLIWSGRGLFTRKWGGGGGGTRAAASGLEAPLVGAHSD